MPLPNRLFVEDAKVVVGLSNTTPSTSVPDRVNVENYSHITVIIAALNATTVTGSAIGLKQSTAADGTDEKVLAFSKVYAITDVAAGDVFTETAVTSNTFTTAAVNSKSMLYQIEVPVETMDIANGFKWFGVSTGNATASTLTVLYVMHNPRYGGLAAQGTVIA